MCYTGATMLTHCPICKYDLTGQPDQHRCPECGYDYDRDSYVAVMFMPIRPRVLVFYGLMLFCAIYFYIGRGTYNILLLSLFAIVALLIQHFAMLQRIAVITPLEIQYIQGRKVIKRVPLSSTVEAYWSFVDGSIRLLDDHGSKLLERPTGRGWSGQENQRLAALINTRLQENKKTGKA